MNEGTKTGIFWVVAACMAAFATFVAWPRSNEETAVSMLVGKELFKEFTDPLAASSMKIVNFDAVLGQIESFEVAKDRQTGVWSIPSRQGYPADGSEQMQQAATALLGLKILDVKSENPEDHDDFGVVEPDLEKLSVGDDGVGRLVTVKNAEGKALVELVIGNEVADFPTHRYVRVPNQDPVYEIELDIDPLTTEFSRWIEDDLLQLSSIDVGATKIRKYSVAVNAGLRGIEVSQQRSYDADLTLDDTNQWSLQNLLVYDNTNAGSMRTLQPGESLNTTALNKLKNALDDLKIVDVVRKPDGMSADLKADKSLVENDESLQSLVKKGFYPLTNSSGDGVDILANNGETIVDLKDGVQYILRFGGVAGIVSEDDQEEEGAEADVGAERYLLVTTRVNESQIPRPEVQPVPQTLEELAALRNPPAPAEPAAGLILPNPLAPASGEPAAVEEPAAEAPAPAPVDEPTAEEPAAEEPPAVEEVPAEASGEGSSEASGGGEVRGGGQEPSQQPPAEEPPAEEPPAEEPPAEEPPAEEPPAEEPAAEEPPAEEPAAEEPPANEWDDLTPEEQQEYLQAEQEKIKKENERLIDEWEEKIAAAQKRVSELNARFADWYYIVPESTYADLQIKLSDLIQQGDGAAAQPNQPPAGPAGLPQFNFSN